MSAGGAGARRWLLLGAASLGLAWALAAMRVPAALLIGPMIVAIAVSASGARMALPGGLRTVSIALIGVMIAGSIEPALFASLVRDWPVVIGATMATLAASAMLGWLISRWRIMPGSTAIWGSMPGGASAMVVMADAFGADGRLVAFMQYVRVVMVSVGAALIARLFVDVPEASPAASAWLAVPDWAAFSVALAVAGAGIALGRVLPVPGADLLAPIAIGVAVHAGAGVVMELPDWLLAAAYVVVGWWIGLRFDRQVLLHALRSLPQIMLAVVALMAFCGAIAWGLARYLGIDPLTAYLATSPGGMDTVAIVAAASGTVDMAFVMALQTMRFLVVLLAGPPTARWLAGSWKQPD